MRESDAKGVDAVCRRYVLLEQTLLYAMHSSDIAVTLLLILIKLPDPPGSTLLNNSEAFFFAHKLLVPS